MVFKGFFLRLPEYILHSLGIEKWIQFSTFSPTWTYLILPSLLSSHGHISSPFPTFPQEFMWWPFMYQFIMYHELNDLMFQIWKSGFGLWQVSATTLTLLHFKRTTNSKKKGLFFKSVQNSYIKKRKKPVYQDNRIVCI